MLLNILAGFTYNIMTSGIYIFFLRINTFSIYYSLFRFRIRYSFHTSSSFCSVTSGYIKDADRSTLIINSLIFFYIFSLNRLFTNYDLPCKVYLKF